MSALPAKPARLLIAPALPLAVVVFAVVVFAAWRVGAGMRDITLASDFALLELSTGEAARGAQWLGPYSRFGWRHPGPAYFYLLAPFHVLAGGDSGALAVAVLVLNALALAALVLALWRLADDAGVLVLALPLAIAHAGYLAPGFLYNIWNPAVTVLPFGLLLVLCAGWASGRPAVLPALVALASFLVQTHIGYLPVVAVVGLVAGGSWALARRRGDAAAAAVTPRIWGLVAVVLALLWALPVVEQLTQTPGNLTRIVRFFRRSGDHPGLAEALTAVARGIAWAPSYAFFGARDKYAPHPPLGGVRLAICATLALAQTALLAWWSWRDTGRFTRALARVCLAATLVAVVAVMRVSGEVRPYLTTWISVVGTLGALAAFGPLLRGRPTVVNRPRAAFALALGLTLGFALVGRPVVRDSHLPGARAVSDAVLADLRGRGTRRAQIIIQTGSPDLFYAASAVLLQLHKAGVAFAVDRPWRNFFGPRWLPSGAEDDSLHFGTGPLPGHAPMVCGGSEANHLCVTRAPALRAPE